MRKHLLMGLALLLSVTVAAQETAPAARETAPAAREAAPAAQGTAPAAPRETAPAAAVKSSTPRNDIQLMLGDATALNSHAMTYVSYWSDNSGWFGEDCYGCFDVVSPALSLSAHHQLKRWLQLGFLSAFQIQEGGRYDRPTGERLGNLSKAHFFLAPSVRFTYLNFKYFSMYSGVSAGLQLTHREGYDALPEYADYPVDGWQLTDFGHLTFLGMRWGNRMYGSVELGYGARGIFSAGVGCRF